MYANKYSASERIVIGKDGPGSDLGHPNDGSIGVCRVFSRGSDPFI